MTYMNALKHKQECPNRYIDCQLKCGSKLRHFEIE